VIRPLLAATDGYAFLDFHPAKLPVWETRSLVLVVPAPTHPLARFSDLRPDHPPGSARYLRLAQTPDWIFYLIDASP
jgi:hypothetical protein